MAVKLFDTLDNSQNLKKVIEGRYILKSYIFQLLNYKKRVSRVVVHF